jgi:hypothetical protein
MLMIINDMPVKRSGFDYQVSYKKGVKNEGVDVLSKVTNGKVLQLVISTTQTCRTSLGKSRQETFQ